MCGIAGIVDSEQRFSPEELGHICEKMLNAMTYRGPDDCGIWFSPSNRCVLGHRRLSIIDTSSGGHQPFSHDSNHGLTYNGEIYNYVELKNDLRAQGMRFHSESDTEVLYGGLLTSGVEFLSSIDGMFAFGFYSETSNTLLLCRDRFGEKPLYYVNSGGLFAFASELKALQYIPGFEGAISIDQLSAYLVFQQPPAPHTIYRDVKKLEPGSFLRLNINTKQISLLRYFKFNCYSEYENVVNANSRVGQLEQLMTESIERRLRADVSVGAFLSGGIDSSTTVSIVARKLGKKIDTYSVGFEGVESSEHVKARNIANYLGTQHHELIIQPSEFCEHVDIVASLDEPNSDHSCVPTYLVSKLASRNHKVCLTGDGGDELFGGYDRYFGVMHRAFRNYENLLSNRWKIGQEYLSQRVLIFDEPLLSHFISKAPSLANDLLYQYRSQLDGSNKHYINRFRELDVEFYLPVVLAKVDRMSMLNSLETRTPFLSPSIADFCMSLSQSEMHDTHVGKQILIRLLRRHLPEDYVQTKKQGFGIPPSYDSIKRLLLKRLCDELSSANVQLTNFFDKQQLKYFVDSVIPRLNFYHVWSLLVLELWLQRNTYKAVR